jgi:hypothetical protein
MDMSSQKAINSGRGRGGQATSAAANTSTKPFSLPQSICQAWEHNDSTLARSVKQLRSIHEQLTELNETVWELPNNSTRDLLAKQFTTFQEVFDDQWEAKEKEARMSKVFLRAFKNKRAVPLGGSGRKYLALLAQVFQSAPEDMTVDELQRAFAAKVVSVKAHEALEVLVKQGRTTMASHGTVPSSASVEDSEQIHARCPTKTDRRAGTPDQHLKDTTNLKPKPTAKIVAEAAPAKPKQDTKPAPNVYKSQPNKIRTFARKAHYMPNKAPLTKTTEPRLIESMFGGLSREADMDSPLDDVGAVGQSHVDEEQDKATAERSSEAHNITQHAEKNDNPTREAEAYHLCIESNEQSLEYSAAQFMEFGPAVAAEVAQPAGDVDSEDVTASASSRSPAASPTPSEREENPVGAVVEAPTSLEFVTSGATGSKEVRTVGIPGVAVKKTYLGKEKVQDNNAIVDDDEAASSTKSTGGGCIPRDHTREPEFQSSNKRKRYIGDNGSMSSKKTALEGRYVARSRVFHLLFAL